VVYFILDLGTICPDLHKYLRLLEEVVIRSLYKFEIESGRVDSLTGVWIGPHGKEKKICAIGIRVRNWVSMHGIAINVNTDLKYFNHIIPCGIQNRGVVSMQDILEEGQDLTIVASEIVRASEELFGVNIIV
jgi:lipoyl(octanoyl) transferase